MKGKFKVKHGFLLLFLFMLASIAIDLVRTSKYQVIPRRPTEGILLQQNELYYELVNGA